MSSRDVLGRPFSVRLPEPLRTRVEALAVAGRRSRGDVVREAMEREIDRLEWEYRIAARAADVRAGRVQTISADEVDQILELEGEPVPANAIDEIS